MPYHRQWHVPEAEIRGQLQHFGFGQIQRIKKATLLKLTLREGIHFLLLPFNREAVMRYNLHKKGSAQSFQDYLSYYPNKWQRASIYHSCFAHRQWTRIYQHFWLKKIQYCKIHLWNQLWHKKLDIHLSPSHDHYDDKVRIYTAQHRPRL